MKSILLCLFLATACARPAERTDVGGPRVVSLIPNATEIIFDLGTGRRVEAPLTDSEMAAVRQGENKQATSILRERLSRGGANIEELHDIGTNWVGMIPRYSAERGLEFNHLFAYEGTPVCGWTECNWGDGGVALTVPASTIPQRFTRYAALPPSITSFALANPTTRIIGWTELPRNPIERLPLHLMFGLD